MRPARRPARAPDRRLVAAVRAVADRLRAHGRHRPGVDLQPCCAYELQSRQLIEELGREVAEVRARVNGLLFLVAGGFLADVLLRLVRP